MRQLGREAHGCCSVAFPARTPSRVGNAGRASDGLLPKKPTPGAFPTGRVSATRMAMSGDQAAIRCQIAAPMMIMTAQLSNA